jgi:hypothetical protein
MMTPTQAAARTIRCTSTILTGDEIVAAGIVVLHHDAGREANV